MTTLYGINNCDTVKKVRRWLDDNGVDYEFHDYKKLGCDKTLATQFVKQFDLEKLINKRGTTWRQLPETVKSSLSSESAITLMGENPSVIKRPILKSKNHWLLGFDEAQWQAALIK
ncbi:MAG: ArsC family reductase [Pseudomonadales bacterium]|nr:ArsC family reductase [Pseudomonadales bacterium]